MGNSCNNCQLTIKKEQHNMPLDSRFIIQDCLGSPTPNIHGYSIEYSK